MDNGEKDRDQKVPGTANSGQPSKEEKPPTLALQPLRHTEARTRLGQNPTLLPVLERALAKAKAKLVPHCQNPQQNLVPKDSDDDWCVVWLLEDTIQKVNTGTYQPAQI